MNDIEKSAVERGKLMGAHSVHQGIAPVDHATVLYCTKCGARLREIEPGGQRTKQLYGPCDCGWGCCNPAHEDHPAHMSYRDYLPGEVPMAWYVHHIVVKKHDFDIVCIDNDSRTYVTQPEPTSGPFNSAADALAVAKEIYPNHKDIR